MSEYALIYRLPRLYLDYLHLLINVEKFKCFMLFNYKLA